MRLRMSVLALAAQAVFITPTAMAQTSPASSTAPNAVQTRTLAEVDVTADGIREPGAKVVLTQDDIEKTGATSMGDVIRYQPLVEAPGTVQGATRGASRYDRSGTTG